MERQDIFVKVTQICKEIFEDENVVFTEESGADTVNGWDSITYLNLMSDIEEIFGITFTLQEISDSKTLGNIMDALMGHIKQL